MKIFSFIFLVAHLFTFEKPLFISLGSHCEVAVLLKLNQLRQFACPFDYLMTVDNEGLIRALDEDFQSLFDKDCLISHPVYPYMVENILYRIEFRHEDYILQQPDRWEEVTEKFNRRVARFREIRNFPGKVIFIRTAYDFSLCGSTYWLKESQVGIDREEALHLKQVLDSYFPCLDFLLVIVNYEEDHLPQIEDLEGIQEYKIRKSHRDDDYQNMFMFLVSGFKKL